MFHQLLDQNPSEANFFEVYEIGDLLGSGSFGQAGIPGSRRHGLPFLASSMGGSEVAISGWFLTKVPRFSKCQVRFDW